MWVTVLVMAIALIFEPIRIGLTVTMLNRPRRLRVSRRPAKVLAALLEKLRSASGGGRRGGLALVRTMTEKRGG
jgi:hypothetical protein